MNNDQELGCKLAEAILRTHSLIDAKSCLAAGANPDYVAEKGPYPGSLLSTCVKMSQILFNHQAAVLLVDYGANVTEVDYEGLSLLMVAIKEENYALARYLVDHGADYDYTIRDENNVCYNGMTALRFLEINVEGNERDSLLEYLKSKGASSGFVDLWG
jgi:ankyrin repeat protein